MLNVTVVGTGYVGLGTAIMLAQLGSPTAHREAETAKAHRG